MEKRGLRQDLGVTTALLQLCLGRHLLPLAMSGLEYLASSSVVVVAYTSVAATSARLSFIKIPGEKNQDEKWRPVVYNAISTGG